MWEKLRETTLLVDGVPMICLLWENTFIDRLAVTTTENTFNGYTTVSTVLPYDEKETFIAESASINLFCKSYTKNYILRLERDAKKVLLSVLPVTAEMI